MAQKKAQSIKKLRAFLYRLIQYKYLISLTSLSVFFTSFKLLWFKLVYDLYSFTSDLGLHITEASKINGELFLERTTQNDALLCLRMTEDVLI